MMNERVKLTSGDTLWVPYLSSQYIVLIRYSCWTLKTCRTTTIVSAHAPLSTFTTSATTHANTFKNRPAAPHHPTIPDQLTGHRSWVISSSDFFGF
jgi:hypothetical protein